MHLDTNTLGDTLARVAGPDLRLALLFGSQASEHARPDSDIDIGILCDAPLNTGQRTALERAVTQAFGRELDLVDLYHAPYPITGEAVRGHRLLGDVATHAALTTRALVDREDFGPLHDRLINDRLDAWLRT